LLGDVPESITNLVYDLPINPITVITFAFEGEQPNDFTAVYVPETAVPFHRVSYPKVFSPYNCPEGTFSVQVEITHTFNSDYPTKIQLEELTRSSLESLAKLKLIEKIEPKKIWTHHFEYGYVVYNKNYEKNISAIYEYFESRNIYLLGRFGAHKYVNVDMCLYDAIDLAKKLNKYDVEHLKKTMSASI
jgi:protoporphyrinogen oxidase